MKFEFLFTKLKGKMPRHGQAIGSGVLGFMNPGRDWVIGLMVAALIFVIGVAYIVRDFYQQFGAPSTAVSVEEQPVVYQDAEVVRFSEFYKEREEAFNALRSVRTYVPPVEMPLAEE